MLNVESDVPLPDGYRSAVARTLAALKVGESFVVPEGVVLSTMYQTAKRLGIRILMRGSESCDKSAGKTRCWRRA